MRYHLADPKPFVHQITGVRKLTERNGNLALLCDPGTGKSRIVVDYLGLLASAGQGPVRALILCPKSVTDSWLTQFDKFLGPGVAWRGEVLQGTIPEKCARMSEDVAMANHGIPMVEFFVLNIEALSSRRKRKGSNKLDSDRILDAVKAFKPHVLVCDESHRLRAPSGNAGRLAGRIARVVPRKILLTGTPTPHSPLDVWGQWRILDPTAFASVQADGKVKPWSYTTFQNRYAIMGGFAGKQVMGFQRLDELEARMAPLSYVVKKEECLDLPPVTHIDMPITLSPTEEKAYRVMKKDLMLALSDGSLMTSVNKLSQMMRLRQISCGFVTTDDGTKVEIGTSRIDACLDLLEDIMASEDRCVVFAWSRWECENLARRINASHNLEGSTALLITGDTTEAERLAHRQLFASDTKKKLVIVAQSRTISLGVNELVAASYGIFLSLSQQRDDLIQGIARLDRQGQTRPVTLYYLPAAGTIDEVVLQSHRDRTSLEDALLKHIKEDK